MSATHEFGGNWTDEKLDNIRRYLIEYTKIFTSNEAASTFRTIYVDAFAGTGVRNSPKDSTNIPAPMFQDPEFIDQEAEDIRKGSARVALELDPGFDQYVFIEKRQGFVQELEKLKVSFPGKARKIRIIHGDANEVLQSWCASTNWKTHRAVAFLDPYGMEVEWQTINALADTKAVDLWLLFPLGQAVNRLLTRNGPPDGIWADKLTRMFGTSDWRDAFYKPRTQMSLFDDEEALEKIADFDMIGSFLYSD